MNNQIKTLKMKILDLQILVNPRVYRVLKYSQG